MDKRKFFKEEGRIIKHEKLTSDCFLLRLEAANISSAARPGQFINIRIPSGGSVFLRRPFSCHRLLSGRIEVLYEVVGEGTRLLSRMKENESLDIIGPLGTGFDLGNLKTDIWLLAGGLGIAPLLSLVDELTASKNDYRIKLLAGARTKKRLIRIEEFTQKKVEVKVASDDGSIGEKELLTDLFLRELKETGTTPLVFACGPRAMLKELKRIQAESSFLAQVSLEEVMACGVGACLGCAVRMKNGYKMVCQDGPVFNLNEVIFDE